MRRQLTAIALLVGFCLRSEHARGAEPEWDRVGEEAARDLAAYLAIDTQNPPGDTVGAVEYLDGLARAAGLPTERIGASPQKPMLVARLRGHGHEPKPIVLLHHMDVVPADPGEWSFPPFAGDVQDGFIRGRGAIDTKSLGIVQLHALKLLIERGEKPRHDVVLLAVADEEIGGAMGTAWLEQNRPDVVDAAAVWDEGGIGLTDAYPAPVLFVSVTEKQVLWLRLVAQGRAGHGSRPFPDAAPQRLTRALERVFAKPPEQRLTPTAREVFRRLGSTMGGFEGFALKRMRNPLIWLFADGLIQQDPLLSALVRDTVALTVLQAGYKPNVIPGRAEAVLDCRLLPDTDPARFLAKLRDTIADPTIRIEVLQQAQPSPESPTDHPMFRAIETAAKRVYPRATVSPFMTTAGTDSRFFRRRGIPSYGILPVLLSRHIAETPHGIDERIPQQMIGPAVRVVYEVLRAL
jgi:acetylornithine deacetylase/succinyl-diaminopimelate desuccinylase-like protein